VELLLETCSAESPALAPESSLFFVFSPLVGSPLTTSAKFAVVSKSPLTGRINDSLAGSSFAIAGKRTGFDAIEIVGRSENPVLLLVEIGQVRLESAKAIWGRTVPETDRWMRDHYGGRYRVASIGPAGERLVHFATISHDGRHAGRGGSGAVLGSKNLKAIGLAGDRQVQWAAPMELNRYAKNLSTQSLGEATAKYRELGTATNLLTFNRLKCLPTRNFQEDHFEGALRLAPESLVEERKKVRGSCAACTIGCEHLYEIKAKKNPTGVEEEESVSVRLEYESLFALGPMCGIQDPDAVLAAARFCDEYGLDTISAGGTIAFAMHCAQENWIDEDFCFGNPSHLMELLRLISLREGIGGRLANGSRDFASWVGGESLDYAPQIKGMEIPGYDPRKLTSMALGFAVGSRGADHNKSSAYELDFREQAMDRFSEDQIKEIVQLEDKAAVMDSLILCKFLRGVFDDFFIETSQILKMVTGWDLDGNGVREIGKTIIENKKRFNIRAGWTPKEDQLPKSFYGSDSPEESGHLTESELKKAITRYNSVRGWSPDGYPTEAQ
jgi:aldehyde:ferredoxin oxidoreductase